MSGVPSWHDDLATRRDRILVALIAHKGHDGIPGAPDGVLCLRCEAERELDRVEAEIARLEQELRENDRLIESAWAERDRETENAVAAEARCAQLEAEALAFDNVRAAYDDLIEERDAARAELDDVRDEYMADAGLRTAAEARCAELERERDALKAKMFGLEADAHHARGLKQNWMDEAVRQEARCARLQQVAEAAKPFAQPHDTTFAQYESLREALAGLDTPADSQPEDGTA